MKKYSLKLTAKILLVCLLFQSCVAYQNVPVSLDQAVDKGRAKIVTSSNEEIIFKKIIYENESYYGIKNNKVKALISPANAETIKIYLKDNKESIKKSIFFLAGSAGGFGTVLGIIGSIIIIGFVIMLISAIPAIFDVYN